MRTEGGRFVPSLFVLLAVALLAGCGGGNEAAGFGLIDWPEGGTTGAEPGELAPNFTLATPNGTVTLSAGSGQPVVITFLASWCPNCMDELDALQAVHETGVAVIGVNLRESADTVRHLQAESGASFPIGLDTTGRVTRAYKVVNLPGTVVLRADGTISTVIRGPVTEATLLDAVRNAEA